MDNSRNNHIKALRRTARLSRFYSEAEKELFDIAKHLDVDVREYMDQSSLIRQFGNKIWYFHFNIVYLHSKMNQ